jgi:cytochrome c551/c552
MKNQQNVPLQSEGFQDLSGGLGYQSMVQTRFFTRYSVLATVGLWAGVAVWGTPEATLLGQNAAPVSRAPSLATRGPAEAPSARAILDQYCVTCHNNRTKTAGLTLDTMDPADVGRHPELWEKVVRKVKVGVMPPQGMPHPDEATRTLLVSTLERSLDRVAATSPFPGQPSIHRLNRAEYANAVRDVLGLEIDAAALLPPDEQIQGFDNIGEALAYSPSLLERYASAAAQIATLAVGDATDVVPGSMMFRAASDQSQDVHIEGLPLGTVGGVLTRPTLPLDGEYLIKVTLFKTNLGLMRGLEFERELQFVVDGEVVFTKVVGGKESFEAMLQNQTKHAFDLEAQMQVRVPLKAGTRVIGATFAQRSDVLNTSRLQAFDRTTTDTSETLIGPPHVDMLTVAGPFNPTGPGDTASRRRIFSCRPAAAAQEESCARQIVSTLARRGYRGTQTDADVAELMRFYREGAGEGGFDRGISFAVERLLSGPKFLVRMEVDGRRPGTIYDITDTELASRLSFFLWSSVPDDELLDLAAGRRLRNAAVLERQVKRMLADDKASAFVTNFAGQWLQLRNLRSAFPDSREYPNFDAQLREAFQRETELFFDSIMREDRSLLDLLTADYTFVNGRLARHYGIPNVQGNQFRRITVTDESRRGLLGQGSILTVTSHANRTSPVRRGKWVLDNLLGSPPPPPPPNVPALKEKNELTRPLTMRERMEEHRRNPVCASCHRAMDPLGFALENFDATGGWRVRDGRVAIDSAGQFVDGSVVNGPAALRAAVLRRPENFVTTVTEKMLMYGLGRALDHRDLPTVRAVVRDAGANNYRFSSLVLGIVRSAPFQKRISVTPPAASTAAL